ncbi:MAG: hypothetical protein ABI220_00780 [Candidatus Saccharimonadales bacterium]
MIRRNLNPELAELDLPKDIFARDVELFLGRETFPVVTGADQEITVSMGFSEEQLGPTRLLHRELGMPEPSAVRVGKIMPALSEARRRYDEVLFGHNAHGLVFVAVDAGYERTVYGAVLDGRHQARREVRKITQELSVTDTSSITDEAEYKRNRLDYTRRIRKIGYILLGGIIPRSGRLEQISEDELAYLHNLLTN